MSDNNNPFEWVATSNTAIDDLVNFDSDDAGLPDPEGFDSNWDNAILHERRRAIESQHEEVLFQIYISTTTPTTAII
jgi:hypothetical protein